MMEINFLHGDRKERSQDVRSASVVLSPMTMLNGFCLSPAICFECSSLAEHLSSTLRIRNQQVGGSSPLTDTNPLSWLDSVSTDKNRNSTKRIHGLSKQVLSVNQRIRSFYVWFFKYSRTQKIPPPKALRRVRRGRITGN